MRIGISTHTYGWSVGATAVSLLEPMDEKALIKEALRSGVSLIQIGDNLPLDTFSKERLQLFKQLLQKEKIQVEVGARGLTKKNLQNYINIAADLNCRILRFVVDDAGYEPSVEDIIEIIRTLLPQLEQYKLILALENHDRITAKTYAYIVKTLDSNYVGICLDSVNSMGAGEGLENVVETLAPYTVNLHIKDFGIKRLPHKMGFIIDGRIAGQGMLDIRWLVDKVSGYNKCQTAILEQWVTPDHTIKQTILKERTWADESISYLKTITKLSKHPFAEMNVFI